MKSLKVLIFTSHKTSKNIPLHKTNRYRPSKKSVPVFIYSLNKLSQNGMDQHPSKLGTVCGKRFRFVEGGAVRVVNGEVDMENIKPKYECDTCGVFYREVLTSGFYLPYPQEEEDKLKANEEPAPSKVLSTGDLAPMILKRNENNQCQCPRCGAMMDYVEGQAVHLVDGKPDMENVWDHFHCGSCHSVFRRIVNTDYFQFAEK